MTDGWTAQTILFFGFSNYCILHPQIALFLQIPHCQVGQPVQLETFLVVIEVPMIGLLYRLCYWGHFFLGLEKRAWGAGQIIAVVTEITAFVGTARRLTGMTAC